MAAAAFQPRSRVAIWSQAERRRPVATGAGRPLRIGLVNNMPDAALRATERQFQDLLGRASLLMPADPGLTLSLYHLPALPRGVAAHQEIARRYLDAAGIATAGLDGLIVTGGEPSAPDLRAEPHWPQLSALVDQAWALDLPTVFSCMAAHAAILHLDAIARRPLAHKVSGVYRLDRADPDPLMARVTGPMLAPHSRGNSVDPADLARAGYRVLTRNPAIGPDIFVKRGPGLFVFTHGHPEYGADALGLEYRRDVRRFLHGERPRHPDLPEGYFAPPIQARLTALAEAAMGDPQPQRLSAYDRVLADHHPVHAWRDFAAQLYAGWLDEIAARTEGRAGVAISA